MSRNAFDIEGFGEKQIELFYDERLVKEPADIFTLAGARQARLEKLMEREGYGETSVRNLFDAIEARRTIALNRLIYALGIRHIGETNARLAGAALRLHRSVARRALKVAAKGEESEA